MQIGDTAQSTEGVEKIETNGTVFEPKNVETNSIQKSTLKTNTSNRPAISPQPVSEDRSLPNTNLPKKSNKKLFYGCMAFLLLISILLFLSGVSIVKIDPAARLAETRDTSAYNHAQSLVHVLDLYKTQEGLYPWQKFKKDVPSVNSVTALNPQPYWWSVEDGLSKYSAYGEKTMTEKPLYLFVYNDNSIKICFIPESSDSTYGYKAKYDNTGKQNANNAVYYCYPDSSTLGVSTSVTPTVAKSHLQMYMPLLSH